MLLQVFLISREIKDNLADFMKFNKLQIFAQILIVFKVLEKFKKV